MKCQEGGENCIIRSFITYTLCQVIERSSQGKLMGRACSRNGEKRNVYRLLVGKPEGKSN
jgi:hypothetical protein